MDKVIVFDIDGTVADNSHRTHWLMTKPKNWRAYDAGMADDGLHGDIAWLVQQQFAARNWIVFATGRSEDHKETTVNWLVKHELFHHGLFMRKSKDFRKDSIIKVELLQQIRQDFGNPFLWFDDRDHVVEAIRNEGVRVLQVKEGNY